MADIKNITIDDINNLKRQRKYKEAEALLEAFREAGRKNFKDGQKLSNRVIANKRRIKAIRSGICPNCNKNKTTKHRICEECNDRRNYFYAKKRIEEDKV